MTFLTKIETENVQEAMEVANHDFTVEKHKIVTEHGLDIPDHVAIVTEDGIDYLGTVGSGWEPVQPKVLYELAQELIDATGGKINGVFSMHGKSVIGISFNLATKEYVVGDPNELNFMMLTSFNGMYSLSGNATIHRKVSNSSMNASSKVYALKHTKFVSNRISVVKNLLKYYNEEIDVFNEKMLNLVTNPMSQKEAVQWFRSMFPAPKSPRGEKALDKQVGLYLDCLLHGDGCNISGVRGTRYGAFQALTEYINHHKSIRIHNNRDEEEVRFQAVHFGSGNTLTQKALNSLNIVDEDDAEFKMDEFML